MTTVLALAISVIVLTTLILVVTSQAAFAQNSGLGVNTLLEKYYPGENITVYGSIDRIVPQVRIQVVDPSGQVLLTEFLEPIDGAFSYDFELREGALEGEYFITASFEDSSAETSFAFIDGVRDNCEDGTTRGHPNQSAVAINNETYTVTYLFEGVSRNEQPRIDAERKSIIFDVTTESDGCLQIRLPKALIDSADQNYTLFVNGEERQDDIQTQFSTSTQTQLFIQFNSDAESIEIQGTWIVPEFGLLSGVVLGLGITGVIAVMRTLYRSKSLP